MVCTVINISGDALVELGVYVIERRLNRANQRLDLDVGRVDFFDRLDVAEEELVVLARTP